MSCFRLPNSLYKSINSLLSNFWQAQQRNERKIHWQSWNSLCYPKHKGGLGFKDLESFKMTLLAKQGQRIMHHLNSLLARVLKGKYFPHDSFMQAREGNHSSWGWKSILCGRTILSKGIRWHIGKGDYFVQDILLGSKSFSLCSSNPKES